MKRFMLLAVVCLMGCGTVRYSIVGEKGRRGHQEIAWDAISLNFNNLWDKILKGE